MNHRRFSPDTQAAALLIRDFPKSESAAKKATANALMHVCPYILSYHKHSTPNLKGADAPVPQVSQSETNLLHFLSKPK